MCSKLIVFFWRNKSVSLAKMNGWIISLSNKSNDFKWNGCCCCSGYCYSLTKIFRTIAIFPLSNFLECFPSNRNIEFVSTKLLVKRDGEMCFHWIHMKCKRKKSISRKFITHRSVTVISISCKMFHCELQRILWFHLMRQHSKNLFF